MQARRRTQGLLIEEMADETVVYDTARHEVHCLNRAATLVWNHCDGETSPAEMAAILREELGLPADGALVRLILEQLGELHLLEERPAKPVGVARRMRREATKQLALYGLAGMVLTIAAPTATQAVSCRANGVACTMGSQCCSGCCHNGTNVCAASGGCH